MIKVLSCRFEQCLIPFTMLSVEMSSETRLFRHLSNEVFGVRNFGNTKSMRSSFFSKRSKSKLDFRNAAKKKEMFFLSDIMASELVSLNGPY